MKILHYTSKFSLPSEFFIYSLVSNLERENGLENCILTHKRFLEKERPFSKVTVVADESILNKIWRRLRGKGYLKLKRREAILNEIKKQNPDVIHAHFGLHGVLLYDLLSNSDFQCPMVVSFHGTDLTSLPRISPEYKRKLDEMARSDWIHFTVQSHFLEGKLKEALTVEKEAVLVNNACSGIQATFETRPKSEGLKIIHVGRLMEVKGQEYLIGAFHQFLEHAPESHLTIIGDGPRGRKLRALIQKLELGEKVTLVKSLPREELFEAMKRSDVFVLPSVIASNFQEESFGMVLLEAIAVGLPVIGSRVGGIPEIIAEDGQFGFLVEQKNEEQLVTALKKVHANDYSKQSNREFGLPILEKYCESKQLESVKKLYELVTR